MWGGPPVRPGQQMLYQAAAELSIVALRPNLRAASRVAAKTKTVIAALRPSSFRKYRYSPERNCNRFALLL